MLPAGVHIGTQAFAVAGTDEWFLTWIKDAECDPVVEIMSRVLRAVGRGDTRESNLGHQTFWWPFSFRAPPKKLQNVMAVTDCLPCSGNLNTQLIKGRLP